jgi:hypothetical protein
MEYDHSMRRTHGLVFMLLACIACGTDATRAQPGGPSHDAGGADEGGAGAGAGDGGSGVPSDGAAWAHRFGGASDDRCLGAASDHNGNLIVTGVFNGTADFGGGPLTSAGGDDIFVAKYDSGGQHVWSRRFGDASEDAGFRVATDAAGNVVVTGSFEGTAYFGGGALTGGGTSISNLFVVKFTSDGDHVWSKGIVAVSAPIYGLAIATTAAGSTIITGWFHAADFGGGLLTSVGYDDIFLVKFDGVGNHLWSQRFGSAGYNIGASVTTDGNDDIIMTGTFNGAADFGGGALVSEGESDIVVAKFDPGGDHLWSKRFGSASFDFGRSVATDSAGNVVVSGVFRDELDFGGGALVSLSDDDRFVVKLDGSGNHLWSKHFGSLIGKVGAGIVIDGADQLIVAGGLTGTVDLGGGTLTSAGDVDVYVAKYDAEGAHLWSERFGGPGWQAPSGVAIGGANHVLIAGGFAGSIAFGGKPLMSAGGYDVFIAKLAP